MEKSLKEMLTISETHGFENPGMACNKSANLVQLTLPAGVNNYSAVEHFFYLQVSSVYDYIIKYLTSKVIHLTRSWSADFVCASTLDR